MDIFTSLKIHALRTPASIGSLFYCSLSDVIVDGALHFVCSSGTCVCVCAYVFHQYPVDHWNQVSLGNDIYTATLSQSLCLDV